MNKVMNKILIFSIMLLIPAQHSIAIEGAEIAVYTDNGAGAWLDGIVAFEQFLDWKGISHERITPLEVNSNELKNYYQAIYFPGGDAFYYKQAVNQNGIEHIRELVNSGGAYIGICAGAYFACDSIEWEGEEYDYPLDLFNGKAAGSINAISPWPDYKMTAINMNPDNPINKYEPAAEVTLYYGGPAFYPKPEAVIDTTAWWDEYNNENAIINFSYGQGRVLLIGPHPEIEEDSDRDSVSFADELNDQGSEWPFLWAAIDWALGRPITNPGVSATNKTEKLKPEQIPILIENYPNPFNSSTVIRFEIPSLENNIQYVNVSIYNVLCQKIITLYDGPISSGSYQFTWHGTNIKGEKLTSGVYICTIQSANFIHFKKMLLIN